MENNTTAFAALSEPKTVPVLFVSNDDTKWLLNDIIILCHLRSNPDVLCNHGCPIDLTNTSVNIHRFWTIVNAPFCVITKSLDMIRSFMKTLMVIF